MSRLSFVVTGRNDGYDGNFTERLATALSRNIKSLPDAEFIFVEWNPYLDRPLVCQELKKIFKDRVQYFVVHPRYHKHYCNIDEFLEYPAKNVGVRRASGEYICCTNSDIIFCPDLIENLEKPLKPNCLYRTNRIDIRLDYLYVNFPIPPEHKLEENYGPLNAAGDFLLMHKDLWQQSTAYCEEFPEQRLHKDALTVYLLADVWGHKVINIGSITHWRHPSSWSNGNCRSRVGDANWDFKNCGYKKNKGTWGLTFAKEVNKDGIIWLT